MSMHNIRAILAVIVMSSLGAVHLLDGNKLDSTIYLVGAWIIIGLARRDA